MQPTKTVRLTAHKPRPLWVYLLLGIIAGLAMGISYLHSVL